jgi:uncharacterized protein (UPF0262 family)
MVKKNITFSSTEEQEESNYRYWLSLTPLQRLELHFRLLNQLYSEEIKKNRNRRYKTIIFDSK